MSFNLRQVRKGNVTMKIWDVAVSFESESEVVAREKSTKSGAYWTGELDASARANLVRPDV